MGWRLPKYGDPILEGLVGWWSLQEGAGADLHDLGPYRAHASGLGTSPAGGWVHDRPRRPGMAYVIQGNSSRYFNTGKTGLGRTRLFADEDDRFSFVGWWSVTGNETQSEGHLLAKAVSSSSSRTFNVYYDYTGDEYTYGVRFRGSASRWDHRATDSDAQYVYHCPAVTWDGETARMYFDGLYEQDASVGSASENTTEPILLGARTHSSGGGFQVESQARLGPQMLWDRALSAEEMARVFFDYESLFEGGRVVVGFVPAAGSNQTITQTGVLNLTKTFTSTPQVNLELNQDNVLGLTKTIEATPQINMNLAQDSPLTVTKAIGSPQLNLNLTQVTVLGLTKTIEATPQVNMNLSQDSPLTVTKAIGSPQLNLNLTQVTVLGLTKTIEATPHLEYIQTITQDSTLGVTQGMPSGAPTVFIDDGEGIAPFLLAAMKKRFWRT